MNRRHVRARRGRQHGERVRLVAGPGAPDAGDRHAKGIVEREAVLGLGIAGASELIEWVSDDRAAVAIGEVSPFGGLGCANA
jgi:hypothetical protein